MSTERKIRQAFEELAQDVKPRADAWSSTRTRIARSHSRRVALAATLALGLITLSAIVAAQFRDQRGVTLQQSSDWTTYRDPRGWTLQHPSSWHSQRVDEERRPYSADGILISNIDHQFEHPARDTEWTSSGWDLKALPPTFILIQVGWIHSGPSVLIPCSEKDSSLPLSLDSAVSDTRGGEEASGGQTTHSFLSFTAQRDDNYAIHVWKGSQASGEDVAAVEKIVASISFADAPSPEQGAPGSSCR